ncbi:MAG: hypothetical protein JJU32_14710 [Phormidium sp. BM_Day4_Bin.17]|nr:hypothetical protein [Phormidium sp. BM_Day4_Bin.17]UCJ11258.1 MAG: lipid-A-disaccharide synthase-related protein [Phormidium sp. PBR-2020]
MGEKLLCLSNGHGEDAIAVRILQQLQQHPQAPELAALPLVGEGRAYQQLPEVPIVGPVKAMPSGGFVYMDGRELWRDVRGGLLGLTWAQWRVVRKWGKQGGKILAVGDIVPLLLAWLSGAPYCFVGTAKSEYYLRDEIGPLQRRSWFEKLESWSGCVYLPWERALMRSKRCQAVFPRDGLTTERLQEMGIRAYNLGNPMMDGLTSKPVVPEGEQGRALTILLLPGSRVPEAHRNWEQLLRAVDGVQQSQPNRPLTVLGAIAPGLDLDPFVRALDTYGWQSTTKRVSGVNDDQAQRFSLNQGLLAISQNAFADCLRQADLAIALAGTATEQFVGLGKPAIAFPGEGPQYTAAFAEAQGRLLGQSLIRVAGPEQVAGIVQRLLQDPDWHQLIAENGRRRLGLPGAGERIAKDVLQLLFGVE